MAGVSPHCKQILNNFDINPQQICVDFRDIRAVVMCRAWYLMETYHIPFKDAVKQAWSWAKEKCYQYSSNKKALKDVAEAINRGDLKAYLPTFIGNLPITGVNTYTWEVKAGGRSWSCTPDTVVIV